MPDLYRTFQLNVQKHHLFEGNDQVILGISGGVDSITLANLLVRYFENPKQHIVLAHVDFHLREDSNNETQVVKDFALHNNLVLETTDWSKVSENGIENAARVFRYDFYKKVAEKYQTKKIVLAHHANDQAETILLKLARGGDWRQFKGMSFTRDMGHLTIVRPLLTVSKNEILEYAKENNLNWYDDYTNFDPEYTARNLIRNQVLPELTSINENAVENIANFGGWLSDLENNQLPEMLRIWLTETAPDLPIKESQLQDFSHLLENPKKPHGSLNLSDKKTLVKNNGSIDLKNN
ncbi:MAG: tRNA lysidine(34) synthetase TilS [Lactobacillaceae bacterium]|jgi:tRNA(Ile)-lysidine synthase|nr:tRNA lysidine(34) synthetase TilS [Lactobacillaceae bacterium]